MSEGSTSTDDSRNRAIDERSARATRAGRGFISIALAKVFFIVTSYGVTMALARFWAAEPETYGRFRTVLELASIVNNVLIAKTIQSVSKMVIDHEDHAPSVVRQALAQQFLVGAMFAALFVFGAPWYSRLQQDPLLTSPLQVVSAVMLCYAMYAVLVGSLNGRQLFQRQAVLDVSFSTLRTVGLILPAALGLGLTGVFGGFVGASVGILLLAVTLVGTGKRGPSIPIAKWAALMGPLALYHFCLNGVLLLDLQILKGTVTALAQGAGHTLEEASHRGAVQAAFYGAAKTFAFVPYQLILSMTFIVFPVVSKATTLGDTGETRAAIRTAMRLALIVLLCVAAPLAGAADGVLGLSFPPSYVVAADALRVLVFGLVGLSLFAIGATIVNGVGRQLLATGIAAVGLALVAGGCVLYIRAAGTDEDVLVATAAGTSTGAVVALAMIGVVLHQLFGAFIPVASGLRACVAAACAFAASYMIPHRGLVGVLVGLLSGVLVYVLVLVLTGELKRADLEATQRILKRH